MIRGAAQVLSYFRHIVVFQKANWLQNRGQILHFSPRYKLKERWVKYLSQVCQFRRGSKLLYTIIIIIIIITKFV